MSMGDRWVCLSQVALSTEDVCIPTSRELTSSGTMAVGEYNVEVEFNFIGHQSHVVCLESQRLGSAGYVFLCLASFLVITFTHSFVP